MKSTRMDRFSYINDDKLKMAFPVGPRFQADVPEWTGPPRENNGSLNEPDNLKWLGVVIWSMKDTTMDIEGCIIGKGKPESCDCPTPGSVLCVKRQINEKTAHLHLLPLSVTTTYRSLPARTSFSLLAGTTTTNTTIVTITPTYSVSLSLPPDHHSCNCHPWHI